MKAAPGGREDHHGVSLIIAFEGWEGALHPREVGLRAVGVGAGQACSQTSGGLVSESARASSPLCRCPAHTLTRSWPRTEELANDWFEPSVQEARPSPTQVHPCDTHVNGRPAPSVSFAFLLTGRAFFWVGTQVTSTGSTEDRTGVLGDAD